VFRSTQAFIGHFMSSQLESISFQDGIACDIFVTYSKFYTILSNFLDKNSFSKCSANKKMMRNPAKGRERDNLSKLKTTKNVANYDEGERAIIIQRI